MTVLKSQCKTSPRLITCLPHLPLESNDEGGMYLQDVSSEVNVCLCADADRFFCSSADGVEEEEDDNGGRSSPPVLIRGHYPLSIIHSFTHS